MSTPRLRREKAEAVRVVGGGGLRLGVLEAWQGHRESSAQEEPGLWQTAAYTACSHKLRLEDSVAIEWESLVTRETKFSFLVS